jgi:hypothetical protein
MPGPTLEFLTDMIDLSEQLLAGRETMWEPRDLPGRYGRAIRSIEHLVEIMRCECVVAGGWAVWHHGYVARLTQDIDVVLPADRIEEFLRAASVSGFEILPQPEGSWPKVRHKETDVKVDILPEGAHPGSRSRPAPTTIPHPIRLGADVGSLRYIELLPLIELKLAAARLKDELDVEELILANPDRIGEIRSYLATVHPDYVAAFERLVERARERQDH